MSVFLLLLIVTNIHFDGIIMRRMKISYLSTDTIYCSKFTSINLSKTLDLSNHPDAPAGHWITLCYTIMANECLSSLTDKEEIRLIPQRFNWTVHI